jgi:hypothetical protein
MKRWKDLCMKNPNDDNEAERLTFMKDDCVAVTY